MAREERGHMREVCVQRKAAGGREAAKTDTHEDGKRGRLGGSVLGGAARPPVVDMAAC